MYVYLCTGHRVSRRMDSRHAHVCTNVMLSVCVFQFTIHAKHVETHVVEFYFYQLCCTPDPGNKMEW